ncbi:MAG: glyoxylate/hydroxypyruvate reductase A [Rhodospirillaceae bacterium]|nr:glyoxylate/hydroxypyruvate reductase A [Rhodospirillaceae bacterium]MDD9918854.1 glyoxylate/hydroxypyruvate reductase A [Rhodospirillaceae bacterium]
MTLIMKPDLEHARAWSDVFTDAMPEMPVRDWSAPGDKADIEFAFVWAPEPGALREFPNLKCIFSIGAGVDHLLKDPDLPDGVPIVRMVEPELTQGMSEYVTMHVLRYHREVPALEQQQRDKVWHELIAPTAPSRKVGILGLGVLGQDCARVLHALKFDLASWSRTPKQVDGVQSFHGADGLDPFLARTEILVCLLPLTAETEGILNRDLFAKLPRGAALINAGRGGHQVEADILEALDNGQLSGATLDVFRTEPLPTDSPFWTHPKVTLTPHIASVTQQVSAIEQVVANIRRIQAGEAPLNTVDRELGY